jgi:hypothetical protein
MGLVQQTRNLPCCASIPAIPSFQTMMHSHNQAVPGRTIEDIKNCAPTIPAAGHAR